MGGIQDFRTNNAGKSKGELSIVDAYRALHETALDNLIVSSDTERFAWGKFIPGIDSHGVNSNAAQIRDTVKGLDAILFNGGITPHQYLATIAALKSIPVSEFHGLYDDNGNPRFIELRQPYVRDGFTFVLVGGAGWAQITLPDGDIVWVEPNQKFVLNGRDEFRVFGGDSKCFLAGTQVSMWDGTKRPIEQVKAGDIVVSYDKDGNLKPGRVKRTMTNRAKQILDVHGLMVTPGHATLCGDGRFNGQHVPILDILRSDGALVREDGSKIRAGTGCRLGTMGDRMITAIIGEQQPNGLVRIAEVGQVRAGTRFIKADGEDVSVLDLILTSGGRLTEDGMIQTSTNGPKMPFRWTFTPSLPKPEDYVLQRSATHLQDIYQANEWETVRPSMPIPTGGEADATVSRHPAFVAAAPVNVPLALRNRPDTPQMNRKYRRAAEAKARKKTDNFH